MNNRDPVHEENEQWYFWLETWADRDGPFPDEQTARAAMEQYARDYLGVEPS